MAGDNASLADMFFGIMPASTFDYVRDMTDKYCYRDFVVEKDQTNRDGNVKKKMLVDCDADTPGARRRYAITSGFMLAWFACSSCKVLTLARTSVLQRKCGDHHRMVTA